MVRDLTIPSYGRTVGDWLDTVISFYIEEVSVGARSGVQIKSSDSIEHDIITARDEYRQWLDELVEREPR